MKITTRTTPSTTSTPTPTTITFPDPVFEGEPLPSVIHPEFSGLNLVTGFRGKGKTSYGLKIDRPENICMVDLEDKGRTLAEQDERNGKPAFKVGSYFQPNTEVFSKTGKDRFDIQYLYDRIIQIVDKIPTGRFTTLFLDNAQDLQDGSAQFIRNNPAVGVRYGVRPENAITGGWGGAWPGVKHLIAQLLHLANSKGIKVVVVSFQLKPAFGKDGKPLFNQFKTTDVAIWHERSVLTLVMVDPLPRYFPVPRALVMKESLSRMWWDEEQGETIQQRRIPPAIPAARPKLIYQYLDKPFDPNNMLEGENVTALELSPYLPTFSGEQLVLMERAARAQQMLGMNGEEES